MKIINRTEFLKLPPYTLYCKCDEYGNANAIEVKYDNCGTNDWVCQELTNIESHDCGERSDRLSQMIDSDKVSYPLEMDCAGRDGLYDDDQLFLIYEQADVKKLISHLEIIGYNRPPSSVMRDTLIAEHNAPLAMLPWKDGV